MATFPAKVASTTWSESNNITVCLIPILAPIFFGQKSIEGSVFDDDFLDKMKVKNTRCVWYAAVVTTTTCRQLGNDMTYDTEKKNPTSHDVADTSAVSGRRVGKTRRHVFKTNCGRHLKRRHFQLSPLCPLGLGCFPAPTTDTKL
jgi:hypothetical protein